MLFDGGPIASASLPVARLRIRLLILLGRIVEKGDPPGYPACQGQALDRDQDRALLGLPPRSAPEDSTEGSRASSGGSRFRAGRDRKFHTKVSLNRQKRIVTAECNYWTTIGETASRVGPDLQQYSQVGGCRNSGGAMVPRDFVIGVRKIMVRWPET